MANIHVMDKYLLLLRYFLIITIVLSVILRYTDSEYPNGIFKHLAI